MQGPLTQTFPGVIGFGPLFYLLLGSRYVFGFGLRESVRRLKICGFRGHGSDSLEFEVADDEGSTTQTHGRAHTLGLSIVQSRSKVCVYIYIYTRLL